MSEVKLYSVPDGYALVSVDALRAWGKLGEVKSACGYPAALAQQAQPVANDRDCPHCNYTGSMHCGDVAKTHGGILSPEDCSHAKLFGSRRTTPPAPQVPAPVVSDGVTREQINALLNDDSQDSEEMHDFARAILALRPQASPDLTFTRLQRDTMICALLKLVEDHASKQRCLATYVPATPDSIVAAKELIERLRS